MLRRLLAVPVTVILLALPACGTDDDAGADGLRVVTAFYPLQFIADRITEGRAEVESLVPPGVEPHDLELSVREVAELGEADLVVFETGLQPAVDEAVGSSGAERALDVADVIDLEESGHEEAGHDEEGHDEEGHDEEAGHEEEDDHGHGDLDPHFWLDPTLMAKVADAFTAEISELDPDNAADYATANQRLQTDLATLDDEFESGLARCTTRSIVVSHDAFGYLGRRYDLDVLPIAGLSPDAEPSPKHLSELADLIEEKQITTVFSERLASAALAKTLADELDLRTAVLDPIEGLNSADATDDYLSLMRANLAAIREADSCT